ncbi:hypothetical protein PF008_g11363 [Phytophthora fragariae]|uniref:Myb/SANT-like domain-containing protein n=1 Tax=Phytophthora fragariae TaxID=53985 RepID=A0A6G0RR38_9STRA|nr:hypothetical protein PF008_g11363 [Phytophthora fragariae]
MATSQPTGGASSTPTVSAAGSGAVNAVTSGSKAKQKGKRSSSKASKKRTALTADKKPNAVLEWTNVIVHDLMSLRYEAHAARFSKAKNNAALKEAWLLQATELSTNQGMAISSEQCKNKLKWLKRKWAEYNADIRATGNSEVEVIEPPGLAQMQEFWAGSSGMNGQTLADSEADGAILQSDNDVSCDDEAAELSRENKGGKDKKRKTMGHSFEMGMQSISEGFQAMAAAMTPAPTSMNMPRNRSVVELMDARFDAMLQRQDEELAQMQLQNQQLAALCSVAMATEDNRRCGE